MFFKAAHKLLEHFNQTEKFCSVFESDAAHIIQKNVLLALFGTNQTNLKALNFLKNIALVSPALVELSSDCKRNCLSCCTSAAVKAKVALYSLCSGTNRFLLCCFRGTAVSKIWFIQIIQSRKTVMSLPIAST